jgi:hypothetical protein
MFIPKTTLPRFLFHCSTVLRLGGYLTGVHPLKIPPRGVEHNFTNNDSNITYNPDPVKRWPESGTDSAKTPKISPELEQIITAWPELPEDIKQAIKALVQTHNSNK